MFRIGKNADRSKMTAPLPVAGVEIEVGVVKVVYSEDGSYCDSLKGVLPFVYTLRIYLLSAHAIPLGL